MNLLKKYSTIISLLVSAYAQRNQYPNTLRLQPYITNLVNIKRSVFNDLGASHEYALQRQDNSKGKRKNNKVHTFKIKGKTKWIQV